MFKERDLLLFSVKFECEIIFYHLKPFAFIERHSRKHKTEEKL